jgi:hypothetical protein
LQKTRSQAKTAAICLASPHVSALSSPGALNRHPQNEWNCLEKTTEALKLRKHKWDFSFASDLSNLTNLGESNMPHIADQTETISTQQAVENGEMYADMPPLEPPTESSPPEPWTEEELLTWREEAAAFEKNWWQNWTIPPKQTVFYTFVKDDGEKIGPYGLLTQNEADTLLSLSGNDLVKSVRRKKLCDLKIALVHRPPTPEDEVAKTTNFYYFSQCGSKEIFKGTIFSLADSPQIDNNHYTCISAGVQGVLEDKCASPQWLTPTIVTSITATIALTITGLAWCQRKRERAASYRGLLEDAPPARASCFAACFSSFFSRPPQPVTLSPASSSTFSEVGTLQSTRNEENMDSVVQVRASASSRFSRW